MSRARLLTALLALAPALAPAASLVEWVEDAPLGDSSMIALGYPVPQPVDTPLPFDGFRSYTGLHMRHQDLAAATPWVHGHVVGATHRGRSIWVYQLGDADHLTPYGAPEQAMLVNGGIHAREWQSPEVSTGIIERIALTEDDVLVDYLRENANLLVVPVLNIDGFLQTQRYPSLNWLGDDPRYPDSWPRDGRMRRKNMRGADEDLYTVGDHLQGVDLNRNNAPYRATSTSSSSDPEELVYHGTGTASESEIRALDAAAQLGPADQLTMFTDVHSFSQVHFWNRNSNSRLTRLTERLLDTFTDHHQQFPAGKFYYFDSAAAAPLNSGIGTTAEYFTFNYQVPSWTLEVEPSGGEHPGLPGGGADYGGLGRNGHDGFILPDSQVERVRTELAQTFTVAFYQQAGPPAIQALRVVDAATGATVFESEWDAVDDTSRQLHSFQAQPLQLGRDYRVWIAWNKPMRWRVNGEIAPLPGQSMANTQLFSRSAESEAAPLAAEFGEVTWLDLPGAAPLGYLRYRDDAVVWPLRLVDDAANRATVGAGTTARLGVFTRDMVGLGGDGDPATVAHWLNGAWAGYEDSQGVDGGDLGGYDKTNAFSLTADDLGDPFVIESGTSAAWFDIERNGEGFMLELLAGNRAVMYWFTYDGEGAQDWYMAEGAISGNAIDFPEMVQVSGGVFGPGFDPDQVVRTPVGHARFVWSGCDAGEMKWVIDQDGGDRRQGRMTLSRLTNVMALPCGETDPTPGVPPHEAARFSGSWYDPAHSGEGYVLQVLDDLRALVYWFSYGPDGARRWFFGTGTVDEARLVFDEMYTTSGGVFGDDFDPDAVALEPWGSLELELGCDGGTASFTPIEEGFPAGELDLVRLTVLDGLECLGD